jgi:hypothetical protein
LHSFPLLPKDKNASSDDTDGAGFLLGQTAGIIDEKLLSGNGFSYKLPTK